MTQNTQNPANDKGMLRLRDRGYVYTTKCMRTTFSSFFGFFYDLKVHISRKKDPNCIVSFHFFAKAYRIVLHLPQRYFLRLFSFSVL